MIWKSITTRHTPPRTKPLSMKLRGLFSQPRLARHIEVLWPLFGKEGHGKELMRVADFGTWREESASRNVPSSHVELGTFQVRCRVQLQAIFERSRSEEGCHRALGIETG